MELIVVLVLVVVVSFGLWALSRRVREVRESETRRARFVHLLQRQSEQEYQRWLAAARKRGYREPTSDAERCRDFLRDVLDPARSHSLPYPAAEFYNWLEQTCHELPPDADPVLRSALALGLMTYGRVDMIDVALAGLAPPSQVQGDGYLQRYPAEFLTLLLPLPPYLRDPLKLRAAREDARRWLEDNITRLRWDAAAGRFLLDN